MTDCYSIVAKKPEFVSVSGEIEQRNYFSFYDYEYYLDVTKQYELMNQTMLLLEGLKEVFYFRAERTNGVCSVLSYDKN